ncbi:MAG: hypothetical protein QW505_04145, partial [Thermoplasmata archaeon]
MKAILSIIIIFLMILISILFIDTSYDEMARGQDFSISNENDELSLRFPNETLTKFDNASVLCNIIAEKLGISPISAFKDNSHNLSIIEDEKNTSSFAFYSLNKNHELEFAGSYEYRSYHWWAHCIDGSSIGALYNTNDKLVQIKILPFKTSHDDSWDSDFNNSSFIMGENFSNIEVLQSVYAQSIWLAQSNDDLDLLDHARNIATKIGLSSESLSFSKIFFEGTTYTPDNVFIAEYHTIILGELVQGSMISGANEIKFLYENNQLIRVDVYCFYNGFPPDYVSDNEILESADIFLENEFNASGDLEIVVNPFIIPGLYFDHKTTNVVKIAECGIRQLNNSLNPYGQTLIILVDIRTAGIVSFTSISGMPYVFPPSDSNNSWSVLFGIFVVCLIAGVFGSLAYYWPPEIFYVFIIGALMRVHIKREEILDNFVRGTIYGFIKANPGASFSEIKKRLSISNGTTIYHLEILMKEKFIRRVKASNLVRYYASDFDFCDIANLTEFQEEILRFLFARQRATC